MEFEISRASVFTREKEQVPPIEGSVSVDGRWTIKVETIEDLLALMKRAGSDLTVGEGFNGRPELTIYDDYVE